jgi:sugar (pentulose or hexulose) kinase
VDCLVTLDAGTGSGRCVVFDAAGRLLAAAQEPFQYRLFDDPDVPYLRGFDLDSDAVWRGLAGCARRALASLPPDARIRGVAATSQREACVFLDAAGAVLYAGPNVDARAALEGMEVQQRLGDRLHAITGHAPPYIFPLSRYLWFRKHGDATRVASLLMLSDWITFRLCGARVAEHSNAGESLLYDVSRRGWSAEVLEAFDVPAGILPPLVDPGTRAGAVTAEAAAATGIPAGTPVFVGGADTETALLGSGVCAPGEVGAVLGTTTPVQMVLDRPLIDPAARLWTSCHVLPGRWVLESNAGETGGAYRWLVGLLAGDTGAAAYEAADAAMAAVVPSDRPVFCHLGPAVFDLSNMSPFQAAGLVFRFPLLHVDRPDRGEILRAYVESVAYAVRGNYEQIAAVSGRTMARLTASGGMVRSAVLVRELADTLGVPLAIAEVPESACLGCALLAAVGAGIHPSLADGVAAMVRTRPLEPDPGRRARCDERYRQWRDVYERLKAWTI